MTVDLLSVRLKEAKRELTNLKTAHKRGLGGLKVFEYDLDISGYTDHVYILNITVNFDPNFTSYPFVSCTPQSDPETFLANADLISMDYSNNGMSAIYVFEWFALTSFQPYRFAFYSSVPIVSSEYKFWESN